MNPLARWVRLQEFAVSCFKLAWRIENCPGHCAAEDESAAEWLYGRALRALELANLLDPC